MKGKGQKMKKDTDIQLAPMDRVMSSSDVTTKHNHQVLFGRKVDGCLRCEELKAGVAPVKSRPRVRRALTTDEITSKEIYRHRRHAAITEIVRRVIDDIALLRARKGKRLVMAKGKR